MLELMKKSCCHPQATEQFPPQPCTTSVLQGPAIAAELLRAPWKPSPISCWSNRHIIRNHSKILPPKKSLSFISTWFFCSMRDTSTYLENSLSWRPLCETRSFAGSIRNSTCWEKKGRNPQTFPCRTEWQSPCEGWSSEEHAGSVCTGKGYWSYHASENILTPWKMWDRWYTEYINFKFEWTFLGTGNLLHLC